MKKNKEQVIYGYARVSTAKQSLDRQITNLRKYNANIKIYQEKYSGAYIDTRKEFQKLRKLVAPGDTIVFDSVSRMSRNEEDGFNLYIELFDKGVNLVFLNETHINTEVFRKNLENAQAVQCPMIKESETINNFMQNICQALRELLVGIIKDQIKKAFEQAEKERDDIRERIKQGIRERKAKGLPVGSKAPRVHKNKAERIEFIKKHANVFGGDMTDKEIKKLIGISAQTLYTYKKEIKQELSLMELAEENIN